MHQQYSACRGPHRSSNSIHFGVSHRLLENLSMLDADPHAVNATLD